VTDPFGAPSAGIGLLDQMRAAGLVSECEVPLAVLYWTATSGLLFIDMWSVRRRIRRGAASRKPPLVEGDRRVSEAEAVLMQFEDHAESLLNGPAALGSIRADDYFLFLPAAGMVEVTGNGIAAVTTSNELSGFDLSTFFGAHAPKDIATTNGNLLRELFQDAIYHEPIELATAGKIQLYLVWENLQSVNAPGSNTALACVFADASLRYRGVARFGTAKWSVSRFASRVI
jgi:hypothetical protein